MPQPQRPAFTTCRGSGDRLIHSQSLHDAGFDPFACFTEEENLMRVALGDICFVGRYHDERLMDLYIVPEAPAEEMRSFRDVTTYYGVEVSRPEANPLMELRAWESFRFRPVSWEDGIAALKETPTAGFSEKQQQAIRTVLVLDAARPSAPHLGREEMRKKVGHATGARVSVYALAMS